MLKHKYKLITLALGSIALVLACKKEVKDIALTTSPGDKAYIKVIHASPSFRAVNNGSDSFHIMANGVKVNGLFIAYGGAFPIATTNGYQAIDPGTINLKLVTPGVGKPDSIDVKTITKVLEAKKYYSLIITDSLASPRDSSQIWLNDNVVVPPTNYYSMRFAHAVMNDTAGKTIDVWSARRNNNLITGMLPGRVTNFASFTYNPQVSDTLIIRRSGTNIELARLNSITFVNQRVYTLLYRGNGDISGTAAKARTLTYYVNK